MSPAAAQTFYSRNRDMAERVLAHMRDLQRGGCGRVSSAVIADLTGYTPRHMLNYLRALESAGAVRHIQGGKYTRWQVV